MERSLTRRDILRGCGALLLTPPLTALTTCQGSNPTSVPPAPNPSQLLDQIQRAIFEFFWTEASAETGQVKDRALVNGNDTRTMASIAATGFGLSALCIGNERGYRSNSEITERVRKTLRFVANVLPHEHGFFYHFIDMNTGARIGKCELSSIDSSILYCGILTARQYFSDPEIRDLATRIYERVDWPWMLNGGTTFAMGWHPETGFIDGRWNHYCELMMIYLLAIGSPTHPVGPETWDAWTRPTINYQGIEYISGNDPLFTHQYSHAWYDFRNQRDKYTDYFQNSVKATRAHKLFCLSLRERFSDYNENFWGISASDYAGGYTAWGGPPPQGPIDGTLVPCATGGSLPFVFPDCIAVLSNLRVNYPKAWGRYSFVDAFNPLTNWYDPDVIGIDLGITMLMAENQRTGLIWKSFMKNSEAQSAMQKVGFKPV
jgi:hypothetical protein